MLKKSLPAIISLIILILFFEVLVRIYSFFVNDYDLEMWKYANKAKVFVADNRNHIHRKDLFLRLMNNDFSLNSDGRRALPGTEPIASPKLAFIGDSVTLAWGVPFEESFPYLIAQGRDFIDFAVGNYNANAILEQYKQEVAEFKPPVVIYGFYINDIELTSAGKHNTLAANWMSLAWVQNLFYRMKWFSKGEKSYEEFYKQTFEKNALEFYRFLKQLKAETAQSHSELYVVLLPDLNSQNLPGINQIYSDIEAELLNNKVKVLNLQTHEDWKDPQYWVSAQDSHPNSKMHYLIFKDICLKYKEVCGDKNVR